MIWQLERDGAIFETGSIRRRDRLLTKGFRLLNAPPPLPYTELQAKAKAAGISSKQTRADLEKALRDRGLLT